ncbi:MAG TPA: DUF2911 domain-containing protein [bacterium]|nr:DUF2911 domain-containing protein [bacterium]HQG44439.1 DUF2911 domain-containing protein [bacterium]HQI48675.1 DUF2911 domain-containing protein [bacterium]HQJ65016.1 DUF2911 domain-containing protein [bacterium]
MKRSMMALTALIITILLALSLPLQAQVNMPRPSPKASVTQTIGLTDVTITYSRPGVKNRTIWGELVPYGKVWRLGANEATTISFADDVTVEGQPLPKGTYSLHAIPNPEEWTIIVNKVADQWGSYNYKQEEDALRITVKPQTGPFVERMLFTFDDVTDESAVVTLAWEKIRVSFKIGVNTQVKVLNNAKATLSPRALFFAAQYAYQNNTELDQAAKWLDASIALEENYQNLSFKAGLLAKAGNKKEAVKLGEKAIAIGKATQRVPPDLDAFAKQVQEWKKK